MKLKSWLLSSFVILNLSGFTQDQQKIEFEEYDLPNGMHVILHEDHSTPIVAVTMMYKVGSKNEKVGRTGFAHFFEHLMFEGTENIDRHSYDKYVEGAGGTLNANTSQDRTFYYELLPSNQLELGMWLESERLLHAKVENIGIETQREVVKEEKRQRVDNQPYGTFMYEVFRRAFKEHPYQWMPIGSMEDLDAAQEEDYVNFYRTFYVPHNVTLSIAGDIDIKQTKAWINKYFASIPNGDKLDIYRDKEFLSYEVFANKYASQVGGEQATSSEFATDFHSEMTTEAFMKKYFSKASSKPHAIPRPSIKEGLLTKEIRDTIYDNIQLPAVVMAYRTPELNHADHYAVDMLTMLLSQGNSSRLSKNVVEKKQKAIMAISFPFPLEDPGIAINLAIANMGVDPGELEKAIEEEVENIQNNLISDLEMEKLKNMIESDFISSNSTMAGIAETLADYYVYQNSTDLINTEIQHYLAVTKEDIQRVAKNILFQQIVSFFIIYQKYNNQLLRTILETLTLTNKLGFKNKKMKRLILIITIACLNLAAFAQVDRTQAPKAQPNPKIEINIPESMKFDNGLEVIMVENHKLPVVSFQLYIDYPIPLEGEKAGLRSIFGEMLESGTKNTPKDKFDETIDYMGAAFYPNSRGFYASSLKKHSPKLLGLLTEVLTQPAFTQEDFDRIIEQNLSNLAALPSDASSMLSNVSDVIKYGENHPYGEVMTEETLKNITLQDVKDFYKKYFTPNKAYLVVVGDVSTADVKGYVDNYFMSWKKGEDLEKSDFVVPTTSGKNVYFVDKPGAVQSVISLTHTVKLTPGHEDEIKLRVLNQILGGGSFSARLMSNLREDKAYTYGCYSSMDSDQLIGSFSAGGSFRNEVTDSAIVQILAEIKRIGSEPVSDTELDLVKKSMTGAFARSLENPQTIARFALNTIRYNLPANYYANYLQQLERVSINELLMVGDKYLSPNNINIIVVGNEEIANKLEVFDDNNAVEFKDYYGQKVERLKEVPEGVTVKSIINNFAMKKMMASNAAELTKKSTKIQQIETISKGRIDAAMADIYVYEAEGAPNKTANYSMIKSVQGNGVMGTEWFDGQKGESVEAGVKTVFEGAELAQKKAIHFPVSQMSYLSDPTKDAELLGIKIIDGVEYYKLKISNAVEEEFSLEYYNVETGLLYRIERFVKDENGDEQPVIFTFTNYEEMEGVLIAKNMSLNTQGQLIKLETIWVSTGKKAKSKTFTGEFKSVEKVMSKL